MDTAIQNDFGEAIDYSFAPGCGDLHRDGWIVLIGHGLTGNKDRPISVEIAQSLNHAGFDTFRFSFSGNGDSGGFFTEATISKEADDLDCIIQRVSQTYPNIAYIGHSMGGAVGLLQASRDRRIDALISVAGMVHTRAFAEAEFGEVMPDAGNMWEDPAFPLSSKFMNDLSVTHQSLPERIPSVGIPWLLLHGSEDDVVLPYDSEFVKKVRGDAVEYRILEGANHVFDTSEQMKQLCKEIVSWLGEII
ncbi:MAG: alpha/beta fold hydrolase [Verrucomicrobiota bacterium]